MAESERDFVLRLRAEMDRLIPPDVPSWRAPAARRRGRWPAGGGVALGLVGLLALSASLAIGGANPSAWSERAETLIKSVLPPTSAPNPVNGGEKRRNPADAPGAHGDNAAPSNEDTGADGSPPRSAVHHGGGRARLPGGPQSIAGAGRAAGLFAAGTATVGARNHGR